MDRDIEIHREVKNKRRDSLAPGAFKTSLISHDGKGIYEGIRNPFTATRYHSLVADRKSLPPDLVVTAESQDDGCIMGVRHRRFPIEGVQFHPESIMTGEGAKIIGNFLSWRDA